ncbi:hypothetical protein KKC67_01880 [Patescibacteria group bacterium]|nr:hypothetical protein [Patescibacteria group bacterium]MBU0879243.1 hypothetical protein [Patescibacteria group bacterium]MBU0879912.1 hypothetical protein [Patescibacteria group bacterium]MBU0898111.1 hypothetical protein [Patescibacteria group bacterium]MBU1062563.1 hypothetical protein [Patescibacteria group bacterium]
MEKFKELLISLEEKLEFREDIEKTIEAIRDLLFHDEAVYDLLKEAPEKDKAKIKRLLEDIKFLSQELQKRIALIIEQKTRH